jgi:hypothetical protein
VLEHHFPAEVLEIRVHRRAGNSAANHHKNKSSSHGGGRTWTTIATLLPTAKMNDVDPHAWLT